MNVIDNSSKYLKSNKSIFIPKPFNSKSNKEVEIKHINNKSKVEEDSFTWRSFKLSNFY